MRKAQIEQLIKSIKAAREEQQHGLLYARSLPEGKQRVQIEASCTGQIHAYTNILHALEQLINPG